MNAPVRIFVAVAALLSVASALKSLPAPGVPCSTVSTLSPAYSTCDPNYVVTNYYSAMKAGTLNSQALLLDSNGNCQFIEDSFEETFSGPTLNTTRWLPAELDGQEHCLGLPPAGPTTCTMMTGANVLLNQTFPAAFGGGSGGVLKLSQRQCQADPGSCCNKKRTLCTNWTGAHLVSAGCIQYGVLELEAAFDMPPAGGGFYFTATYIVYGDEDKAWNEIDIGMINNVNGQLEFHATVFTANVSNPTATLMDALNIAEAGIGPSVNVNSKVNLINGVPTPQVTYGTAFAQSMHTYKIVWAPTTVVWMVDKVVYRNITYSPWRPMSVRQILRTNKGVNLPLNSPDTSIYIRRIRYTPYSDKAADDALRCTSMYACYGTLKLGGSANATMFVSVATSAAASAGRRHILQSAAATAQSLGAAVAASIPGVSARHLTVTPSAYGLSFTVTLSNIVSGLDDALETFKADGLQTALLSGLASDVAPSYEDILIEGVTDPTGNGTAVAISVLVGGYTSAAEVQADFNKLISQGASALNSAATSINNAIGAVTSSYITTADPAPNTNATGVDAFTPPVVIRPAAVESILTNQLRCPNYPDFFDSTCKDDLGRNWTVWCSACVLMDLSSLNVITTFTVSAPVAKTAVRSTESALNAALISGALTVNLKANQTDASRRHLLASSSSSSSSLNVSSTNNLVAQRLLTDSFTGPTSVCDSVETQLTSWRSVGIAFVIAFVVFTVAAGLVGYALGKRSAASQSQLPQSLVAAAVHKNAALAEMDAASPSRAQQLRQQQPVEPTA